MASQAPLPPPADYLGTTFGVSKDQLATVVRNNNIAKIVETCCPTRYLTWNNNGGLQLQGNGSNNKDEHVARSIVVAAYGEALAVKCGTCLLGTANHRDCVAFQQDKGVQAPSNGACANCIQLGLAHACE